MSRNQTIAFIIASLIIAVLMVGKYFKLPGNEELFEFPDTTQKEQQAKQTTKEGTSTPIQTELATRSQSKEASDGRGEESEAQENYEPIEGLSEEALYGLSTRVPLRGGKNGKETATKNDRTPAELQTTEQKEAQQSSTGFMQGQPQESEPTQATGSTEQAGTVPIIASTTIIAEQPSTPDTGHGTTEPTETTTGPLTASLPQTQPGIGDETKGKTQGTGTSTETTETETGTGTQKFFFPGDQSTTILGGELDSPEVLPRSVETKQPGGRDDSDPVAFQAVYTPDEIVVGGGSEQCDIIAQLSADQFPQLSFGALEFNTEYPSLNRFDFRIPFSSLSTLWSPRTPLRIVIAVSREDQSGSPARVTTARWNNLPAEIRQDTTFTFSVTSPRVFSQPARTRIMLWAGEEGMCIEETELRKLLINIEPVQGRIYPIPSEVQQPSLTTSQGSTSGSSVKLKDYPLGQDN